MDMENHKREEEKTDAQRTPWENGEQSGARNKRRGKVVKAEK